MSQWSRFIRNVFTFFLKKKNKKQKTKRQLLSGECRLVKLAQYLPEEAEVNKAGRRMERGSQELLSIGQVVIILLAMFPHSKQRKRLIGHVSCLLVMLELLIGQTCFHPTFCAFIMIQKKKVPQLSLQTIFRDFFFRFVSSLFLMRHSTKCNRIKYITALWKPKYCSKDGVR